MRVMSVLMADKIRLVVLTDDDVRAALRLAAAKADKEQSEMAHDILSAALVEELAEVRARKATDDKKKRRAE